MNVIRNYVLRVFVVAVTSFVMFPQLATAQSFHRNSFENGKLRWRKAGSDVTYQEKDHKFSTESHIGKRSEFLHLQSGSGKTIYYQYPTGRAPVNAELMASVWIKSDKPNIQVLARVVLPHERDPNNLQSRLTTVLIGETYTKVGRWQPLSIRRPEALAKKQQVLMQAKHGRAINFKDAYVDALLLNVYGGPGETKVWIDDLSIGPVYNDPPFVVQPKNPKDPAKPPTANTGSIVEFSGTQLLVGGKRFFFRGIRHTDTPLHILKKTGLNTVFLPRDVSDEVFQQAVDVGLWVAPQLNVLSPQAPLSTTDALRKEVERFSNSDAILFWHLAGTLAYQQSATIAKAAQIVHGVDAARRPLTADVWDGLMTYSRSLQMIGVYRWPLMTTMELSDYRSWLVQRRMLAHPDAFFWTWIQTHTPDWYTQLLYNQPGMKAFEEPVGPQPEQIRLLTYLALGSGCKGLGFWSDRFLADSHHGRDRLLCLALLNQELDILNPFLVEVDGSPQWISTSNPNVQAAVLRTSKGVLVLPIWMGEGSQFVPGQSAASKLTMIVPQVPQSSQAWEVTPGEVRSLRVRRVVGGMRVTIPEFGLTTAIAFTSDIKAIIQFQRDAAMMRRTAAQFTHDMALYEFQKVLRVHRQLEQLGQTIPDAPALIRDAESRLRTAKEYWQNNAFREAYRESQRALRPVRILMRAHWDKAVQQLDSPVSSPYAVSYFTLPKHLDFVRRLGQMTATANVLPGGDFEIIPQRIQERWRAEDPTLDEVDLVAERVGSNADAMHPKFGNIPQMQVQPREGKQCLMLHIRPKAGRTAPIHALENTILALNSPSVNLKPGTIVRISGWVKVPQNIMASPDGALLYDSAGGEPLAIRLTKQLDWKKWTIYRSVPASGRIHVTLALTGLGTVYFDDVRIEPLAATGAAPGS